MKNETLSAWPSELVVFRGNSAEEAHKLMKKIVSLYQINSDLSLTDVAYSLGRYSDEPIQYALVVASSDELLNTLSGVFAKSQAGDKPESVGLAGKGVVNSTHLYCRARLEGKVAFLFSGQGSQRINMAKDLFCAFPRFGRQLRANPSYLDIVFPNAAGTDDERRLQREAITDTRNAQPLLGMVDYALANFLRDLGIQPEMVAGHSYGEVPALVFAGSIAEDDLVSLSCARANAILDAIGADPGKMLAVKTDIKTLHAQLKGVEGVWPANFNSPRQTVVAGTSPGIDAFANKLAAAGVSASQLGVAAAFHSPVLATAQEYFAQALKNYQLRKPKLEVWSNTTAAPYPQTPEAIKERLAEHLVQPVRFTEQIGQMHEQGARVFIEVGPGSTLGGLAKQILDAQQVHEQDSKQTDEQLGRQQDKQPGSRAVIIQTERNGAEGISYLLHSIAQYIATGRDIKTEKLFEGREAKLIEID